ncbi:unnamed protein product [Haemonchus placei]|uniref:Receptor expression-enhancing protein n=1 Tax=Haemonchus placei TaxID=6290 RepID=A0A158QQY8_HAEPC|nr:unnamed protein product [Haemonchus placei]
MFSLICHFASAVVGALIPVFYSYKTIKRPSQKKLSYWSKYWAVFGSFLGIDVILSSLFIHYFIPFYEFGKLLFLIWAVCPQTAGAQFVFDKVLAPFIHRHEKKMDVYIENFISRIVNQGPDMAISAGTALLTVAKNLRAQSLAEGDSRGRLYPAVQQSSVVITEIVEDDISLKNALRAIPDVVEVKEEPADDYVEEVLYDAVQQRNEAEPASTTNAPLPVKRGRGRRPGSGATTRQRKPQVIEQFMEVQEEDVVVEEKPKRLRRRRSLTRKKLVIVEDHESGSDA